MPEAGRTAVIFSACSGIISGRIAWAEVEAALAEHPARPVFRTEEVACAPDSQDALAAWLRELAPQRVVVAGCSPRDHEDTFRALMTAAGLNPWLLHMVNIREQVAWVTEDPAAATEKATRLLRGALARVALQVPLAARTLPVQTGAVVVGAGPAGLQAALTLARAGREVTLVERDPFLGGLPVRFETLYPGLDCGPCLMEPLIAEVLHGPLSDRIRLLPGAEVVAAKGRPGAWTLGVRQRPRHVTSSCIGCMMCVPACPVTLPDPWSPGGKLHAVDSAFLGALPNLPQVAAEACLRLQGGDCTACLDACPVPGALDFSQGTVDLDIEAGAIVLATGAEAVEAPPAALAGAADLLSAYGLERRLAQNGSTEGRLLLDDGREADSLVLVQCAHGAAEDCTGDCGRLAMKLARLAKEKVPGLRVTRLVRAGSPCSGAPRLPGEAAARLGYEDPRSLRLAEGPAGRVLRLGDAELPAALVAYCGPMKGSGAELARILRLPLDPAGFLLTLHPVSASTASPVKGVFLAGSCRGPGDLRDAFASGTAAAGLVLSELVEGRELAAGPQVAQVDPEACAGCRTCVPVCPYRAITWLEARRVADVSDLLCEGCGTCVATCPSGAITGNAFSREMLRAELGGVLA